jgi:hypothetical protein
LLFDVKAAVWMMRAVVVNNVLARREGTTLFVPNNPGERSGRSDRGEDGDGRSPPRRDTWRHRLNPAHHAKSAWRGPRS